ncbi:MAG TPA: TlpA disulfide reductase family protein [Puia sp.]|nr:TlpA disulfide reductase family protein [Puia sp.]
MIIRSFLSTMKTISIMSLSLLVMASCHEKKKGSFSVAGTFKNADKLASMEGPVSKVFLLEVPYGKDQPPVVLDSVKISGNNGSFSLSGAARSQEVYELVFGNNAIAVPLVNDAQEIKVNVDLGKKDDFYEVSGSDATTQLKDLITIFGKKNFEVERSMGELDSLKQANAPDSVLLAATTKKNNTIQDLNTYLKQFINTNGNATVCALALSWSSRSFTKADFEASLNDLGKKYPNNAVLQGLKLNYEQQLAQMADKKETSWVGKQAPDLALPDANGHPIPLTSYKGKFLLVDFWASWCGPCRAENPNVVKAYSEFKNKNFAILGVSLDKDKDAWQQAIQADKLDWAHVSDLKYWNSKAVEVFKFEGIPFNVLIDPQGKIIGESLRGEELEKKLKEVLSN